MVIITTFFIVCGGTAGHVNPGLTIAEEIRLRIPEAEIIFIGADRDIEKRLVPAAGYELINIKMSGVQRGLNIGAVAHNFKTVRNVVSAQRRVKRLLKEKKPSAVVGTGGYICYPVLKAAARMKIPTFLHESNACPGMAVKALSNIADKVMITYPGFESEYKQPERLVVTGTPIRKEIIANTFPYVISNTPLVISFWGSLGAEKMNEIMQGFISRNRKEKCFHHIHATGKSKGAFEIESDPPFADIREYIENMPEILSKADLVLCRSGGMTLAELTAAGRPSILIPSSYVPDNVQYINARQLSDNGAAIIINESDCNADMLFDIVSELLKDRKRLADMSNAARKLAATNAVKDIVDIIFREISET